MQYCAEPLRWSGKELSKGQPIATEPGIKITDRWFFKKKQFELQRPDIRPFRPAKFSETIKTAVKNISLRFFHWILGYWKSSRDYAGRSTIIHDGISSNSQLLLFFFLLFFSFSFLFSTTLNHHPGLFSPWMYSNRSYRLFKSRASRAEATRNAVFHLIQRFSSMNLLKPLDLPDRDESVLKYSGRFSCFAREAD